MNNRSHLPMTLSVLILMLVAAGCQEDVSSTVGLVAPLNSASVDRFQVAGVDNPTLHHALEAIWKNTRGVQMQVFKQVIDCRQGGVLKAHPVGWPRGYDVTLTVDPGTLPLNHDPVVEFVVEVPVTGPTATSHSIPYEFHPDGIQFNQPVHINAVWPQWAGPAPAGGMDLWYLEQEMHGGVPHYRLVDRRLNEADPAVGAEKATAVPQGSYSVAHFSRWNLTDPALDGDEGGIATWLQPEKLATLAGQGCWTDLASNGAGQDAQQF